MDYTGDSVDDSERPGIRHPSMQSGSRKVITTNIFDYPRTHVCRFHTYNGCPFNPNDSFPQRGLQEEVSFLPVSDPQIRVDRISVPIYSNSAIDFAMMSGGGQPLDNSRSFTGQSSVVAHGLLSPYSPSQPFVSTQSCHTFSWPYNQDTSLHPLPHPVAENHIVTPRLQTSASSPGGHLQSHHDFILTSPVMAEYSQDWPSYLPGPYLHLQLPVNEGLGPFIPQKPYRPQASKIVRRYVDDAALMPPVSFVMNEPYRIGISLSDAFKNRFTGLNGRDDAMFEKCGPSVSIRLQWIGYQSWSRQVPTCDFRTPPRRIARSRLAKVVAKSVERFLEEHSNRPLEQGFGASWRAGPGHITLDDLILVSLHHVSQGSWQPHLRLRQQPPATL